MSVRVCVCVLVCMCAYIFNSIDESWWFDDDDKSILVNSLKIPR